MAAGAAPLVLLARSSMALEVPWSCAVHLTTRRSGGGGGGSSADKVTKKKKWRGNRPMHAPLALPLSSPAANGGGGGGGGAPPAPRAPSAHVVANVEFRFEATGGDGDDDDDEEEEEEEHMLSTRTDPGGGAEDDEEAEEIESVQSRRKLSGSCIHDSW